MVVISTITVTMILLFMMIYGKKLKYETGELISLTGKKSDYFNVICLLLFAFVIRAIAAVSYSGHGDMDCFFMWSDRIYEVGFRDFYSDTAFTDYPPGYMYVLYIMGFIRNVFGLTEMSGFALLLMKFPAIVCDLLLGGFIYKIASKRMSEWGAIFCSAMYLFNPLIILDSAIWGQIDSVFTLLIVLTCYFLTQKKLIPAYFVFAIGILIKPQTLIFTPVLIFAIIQQVFLRDFSWDRVWKELLSGLSAIGAILLLALPFGLGKVIPQYIETMASYPYAAVNAYNFWSMFGLNWRPQEGKFALLSYNHWGTLFIILTVIISGVIFFRAKKDESRYYFTAAVIVTSMFFLSVRMHERYMFPAIALFLLAFIMKPKKDKFLLFVAFSVTGFLNSAHVLFYYDAGNYDPKLPAIIIISFLTFLGFSMLCYTIYREYIKKQIPIPSYNEGNRTAVNKQVGRGNGSRNGNRNGNRNKKGKKKVGEEVVQIQSSDPGKKLKSHDILAMAIITLVYAGIAFYNLGDRFAPENSWESNQTDDQIVLDLGSSKTVQSLQYFLGNYEGRKFRLEVSESEENGWEVLSEEMKMESVFCWDKIEINKNARYIRLTTLSEESVVFEMALKGNENENILPVNASEYQGLFDEQDLVPKTSSFRNSTYFDEIYHARTAYEFIHGIITYETTHPPLGKVFISIGMLLFGVNPFGWRFMGTLFGVAMLPFFYLFAKRLWKESWLASIVTVLFAFDFMHFAQTRIATIDVFVTFFIILMYYFMYCYTKLSFYDTPFKKTLIPLGLSGIFMGFGIASKWTGVYAGCGLAILFFLTMYRRYREYKYALSKPKKSSGTIEHLYIISHFTNYIRKTLIFCVLVFVLIPVIIYLLSYIPFVDHNHSGLLERMLNNQESMYSYHSGIEATHPYSSWWYQWPIMVRPIWYYSNTVSETVRQGISAFGNPLVWWAGIPAFIYMIYLWTKEKDRKARLLAIAYLAQYIPWFFVTRITFIYHYFPSVPFVVFMIGYSMYRIVQKKPRMKKYIIAYTVLSVILFAMFYPVLSGQAIPYRYADIFLKWFDSWVLV